MNSISSSAASAIVTNATNLNIFHGLTFDFERLDTVQTIAHPISTARAPMEIGLEIDIHAGSTRALVVKISHLMRDESPGVPSLLSAKVS